MSSDDNHHKQTTHQQKNTRTGKTVGFLSMAEISPDWCIYDDLLIEPLCKRGFSITKEDARLGWENYRSIDWSNRFDFVICRSTWNYQSHVKEFLECLDYIKNHHLHQKGTSSSSDENININKPVVILNDVEVMKWNSSKEYLADLTQKARCVINPTLFLHDRSYYSHLLPTMMPSSPSSTNDSNSLNNNNNNNNNTTSTSTMITRSEFEIIIRKSLDIFPELLLKPTVGASSFGIVTIKREDIISDDEQEKPFIFTEDPVVVKLRDGELSDFGENLEDLQGVVKRDEKDKMKVWFKSKLDRAWCLVRAANAKYLIQPFLKTIKTHGETSVFFFSGKISHAMHKVPDTADENAIFVQEEYGAKHTKIPLSELQASFVEAAQKTFKGLPGNMNKEGPDAFPLYARIDLVPLPLEIARACDEANWGICCQKGNVLTDSKKSDGNDDVREVPRRLPSDKEGNLWSVMEMELIEPSLYFEIAPEAITNFCDAFTHLVGGNNGNDENDNDNI